jgi:Photosynthesis system II assembly factor YCF48
MAIEDREKQFERALARHLSNASPGSACPETEILAAYHERTLSSEEMTQWKDHIAACARCQESLALVEQTDHLPVEEWELQKKQELVFAEDLALRQGAFAATAVAKQDPTVRSSAPVVSAAPQEIRETRKHPPLRWIIPLGAIAAAVIVWIGVGELRTQHFKQMENAQIAGNRTSPQLLSPNSIPPPAPREMSRDSELEPVVPPSAKTAPAPANRIASKEAVPPSPIGGTLSGYPAKTAPDQGNSALPAGATGRVLPSPPPSPSPAPIGGLASNAPASANRSAPASVAAPPQPNPSLALQEEAKKTQSAQQVQVLSETAAVDSSTANYKDASSALQAVEVRKAFNLIQMAQTSRLYVVAPGEKQAWRLGDDGKIEHSTDRGKTWKPQNSGVAADLTAGSATSEKICWVVGKAGTLLFTTDSGKHWKQIASPITGDLGGVHATDATHASIWDVPNRQSYETNDGGVTWTRIANE